jgi:hypothetical protein
LDKASLIDFKEEQTQVKLHKHDIIKRGLNRDKRVLVPILKPEHIGEFAKNSI